MFWRSRDRRRRRLIPWNSSLVSQAANQVAVDPLIWLTRREAHQAIRDTLSTLTAQDREILMLKHTEDWTYAQIADHLGISMDKVIYRQARAKDRMRRRLHQFEWDG
jgi:RNA polymerase sigma-70 factor (ECF subfamily)